MESYVTKDDEIEPEEDQDQDQEEDEYDESEMLAWISEGKWMWNSRLLK